MSDPNNNNNDSISKFTVGKVTNKEISDEEAKFRVKLNQVMEEVAVINDRLFGAKNKPESTTKNKVSKRRHNGMKDEEFEEELDPQTLYQPQSIKLPMRDYQVECLNWLWSLHKARACGIIADEMGLGKTLETISFLAHLKDTYPHLLQRHLIIVPKSTLINWKREFERFCPDIRHQVAYGEDEQERNQQMKQINNNCTFEAVLTTSEVLLKEIKTFEKVKWDYLIIDEGHKIKNIGSQISIAVRQVKSDYRLLLTGTPIQNNIHELWSLMNFLMPTIFKNSDDFEQLFTYISSESNRDYWVSQLHKMIRPFILRRLKAHVETRLLPKKEVILFVGLSEMQKYYYKNIVTRNFDAITTGGLMLRNVMMQLRKCCLHPYVFPGAEPEPFVEGEHLVNNSEKLRVLDILLKKLQKDKHKVLIFSQFKMLLDILEDYCIMRDQQQCRLDGETSNSDRMSEIDAFQDPTQKKFIFLLSTKAGGLGINLTAADTVIIQDQDWNPQNDKQAEDRAHRIGQTKQVVVQKLVTEHAIEQKICERALMKLKLDHLIIQSGGLAKNDILVNKNEFKNMIQFGLGEIMKVDKSKEYDIDKIIENSFKTQKEDIGLKVKKLEDEFKLNNLNQDQVSTFFYEGKDYRQEAKNNKEAIFDFVKENLGNRRKKIKREKEKNRKNWRDAVGQIYDFQFFETKRMDELDAKKANWELREENDDTPEFTKEDDREQTRLQNNPFGKWSKRDFNSFINGSAKHGRDNITAIAKDVGVTNEELKAYHKKFWKFYFQIDNVENLIKKIEKGEEEIKKKQHVNNVMSWTCREEDCALGFKWKGKNLKEHMNVEDYHIVSLAFKHNFNQSNVLKEIHTHQYLKYSHGLKFAREDQLKRRVEKVYKMLEKEYLSALKDSGFNTGMKVVEEDVEEANVGENEEGEGNKEIQVEVRQEETVEA